MVAKAREGRQGAMDSVYRCGEKLTREQVGAMVAEEAIPDTTT